MTELRKVQRTGGSTLIISLPRKWVSSQGIEKGDTLALFPGENNTLIIDSQSKKEKLRHETKIRIEDSNPEHFFRRLIAIYIAGNETIEISTEPTISPEMRAAIRRFTRMVIGPEITEEDINSVQVKDLSDSQGFGMKSVVKRIYRITFSMLHDSLNAIKDAKPDIARDVISRDSEVDRLYWLLYKQYNLMLKNPGYLQEGPDTGEGLNLFLVGRILERVADHAKNISENHMNFSTTNKRGPLSKDVLKHFDISGNVAMDMLESSFKSFITTDILLANRTIDDTGKLLELYSSAISNISGSQPAISVAIAGIMDSVKRTGMYASDIAEITINSHVRN